VVVGPRSIGVHLSHTPLLHHTAVSPPHIAHGLLVNTAVKEACNTAQPSPLALEYILPVSRIRLRSRLEQELAYRRLLPVVVGKRSERTVLGRVVEHRLERTLGDLVVGSEIGTLQLAVVLESGIWNERSSGIGRSPRHCRIEFLVPVRLAQLHNLDHRIKEGVDKLRDD
jgi:hypothetical protein